MVINQRDVVLIENPPLDQVAGQHLFIVLSIEKANNFETSFIGVMITSNGRKDIMSFALTNDMFEKDLPKSGCQARMHLLTLLYNEEMKGKKLNEMKVFYFNQLMKSIGDLIFNFDFSPQP